MARYYAAIDFDEPDITPLVQVFDTKVRRDAWVRTYDGAHYVESVDSKSAITLIRHLLGNLSADFVDGRYGELSTSGYIHRYLRLYPYNLCGHDARRDLPLEPIVERYLPHAYRHTGWGMRGDARREGGAR